MDKHFPIFFPHFSQKPKFSSIFIIACKVTHISPHPIFPHVSQIFSHVTSWVRPDACDKKVLIHRRFVEEKGGLVERIWLVLLIYITFAPKINNSQNNYNDDEKNHAFTTHGGRDADNAGHHPPPTLRSDGGK